MWSLEVHYSDPNGWAWTIRRNGAIEDAGIEFDREEAVAMGRYMLAKYRRECPEPIETVVTYLEPSSN